MSNLQHIVGLARYQMDELSLQALKEVRLIAAANEGKNELVKIIRQAREDFFISSTTGTISAVTLPAIGTITLPTDFAELKDIEITTLGYEDTEFFPMDRADPRFFRARLSGGGFSGGGGWFYYDIVGKNEMQLAPGPDIALDYRIWYIQMVGDMVLPTDAPTQIPAEHYDFIVTWVVCDALRTANDPRLNTFLDKLAYQRNSVVESVNQRQVREATYVQGFLEDFGW